MTILKILGIAAGIHAVALLLIFANPGCSYSNAASADASPISSAPADTAPAAAAPPASDGAAIRYSPTRPGTVVASALEAQPVGDVTPASAYTVAKGDSLWTIAKKNGLTKAELAAANNLKTTAVLHVGQKLIIPAKSAQTASAAAAPATQASKEPEPAASDKSAGDAVKHVVKPGETLGGIARRYGVKQGDIAVANNITDPKKIHPGQELVIPAKSGASSKGSKGSKSKTDSGQPSKAATTAPAPASGSDQDLDAGLKPASATEVPVIKIEDSSAASQPKNP